MLEYQERGRRAPFSLNPLHEAIHHALLAGLVERNRRLVAVDGGDVAEFLVEDAVAQRGVGDRAGRFGDQLAFDGERQAAGRAAFVAGSAYSAASAFTRKGTAATTAPAAAS